jgi:hypothetical protein
MCFEWEKNGSNIPFLIAEEGILCSFPSGMALMFIHCREECIAVIVK